MTGNQMATVSGDLNRFRYQRLNRSSATAKAPRLGPLQSCQCCATATNSTVIPLCSFQFSFSVRAARDGKRAMQSKSQNIRDALAAGDRIVALRIAAHFHDRSNDTLTYKRGLDAHNHPALYRQIGQEPGQLTAAALELLERNFNLKPRRCARRS
jgi:hypothetical protein